MDDNEIIGLFNKRSEDAIAQVERKYGTVESEMYGHGGSAETSAVFGK